MEEIKVSELPIAQTVENEDTLMIVQEGINKQATVETFFNKLKNIYSTDEKVIGTWIDGSPIYRKTCDLGALPRSTTQEYRLNIENLSKMIKMDAFMYEESSGVMASIPYISPLNDTVSIYSNGNDVITIITKTDRRSFNGYVTVEYTKN